MRTDLDTVAVPAPWVRVPLLFGVPPAVFFLLLPVSLLLIPGTVYGINPFTPAFVVAIWGGLFPWLRRRHREDSCFLRVYLGYLRICGDYAAVGPALAPRPKAPTV